MSIATGRDSQASSLLEMKPQSLHILIPSICCMEALSAFEDEQKRRNRFENELNLQISQLRRDETSPYAKSLLYHLEQSLTENQNLLNDVQIRLFAAIDRLTTNAEMIELTTDILQESLRTPFIKKDSTDNLILHCILAHAHLHATDIKVFLSGNYKEFDTPEIKEAFRNANVVKYFTITENFLGWLQSQTSS